MTENGRRKTEFREQKTDDSSQKLENRGRAGYRVRRFGTNGTSKNTVGSEADHTPVDKGEISGVLRGFQQKLGVSHAVLCRWFLDDPGGIGN